MSDENQAQADAADATNQTVVDPLDAAISQDGANTDDFYREVQDALSQPTSTEPLQGGEPATAFEQPVEDESEPEQEEESEQISEEEEEQASDEDGEDAEDANSGPKRIRVTTPEDRAIAAISKARKCSLAEATDIYRGANPQKPEEDKTETQAEATETVASVRDQIKDLEAKAKDAAVALNFDESEELRAQANELRDKLMDLKLSERDAEKQAEAKQEQEFYAKYQASEERTLQLYPDAGKADSPLAKEMARLDAQMRELEDPLYFSENKPLILAKQAAVKLGIPMTKPGEAKPAPKTVQRRPMQPASGNARTTTTDAAKRNSEAIDGVESLADWEQMVAGIGR
jgi:hypothetical protein